MRSNPREELNRDGSEPLPEAPAGELRGRRIAVRGTVQGVGFRPWVFRLAQELGIRGRVENGPAGVSIECFAAAATLDEFERRLRAELPLPAHIDALHSEGLVGAEAEGFVIAPSRQGGPRRANIPPDLAMCLACACELHDPVNRRYRYPFICCTACGPRFTLATDVPYDRATTTMARFELCAACLAEYQDPHDRRFHAEPTACPACGPRLWLEQAGERRSVDTREVAERLLCSELVALKGLGGYHLVCSATDAHAVSTLRLRKGREAKPLAVMVRDLAAAERLAELGPEERLWLERPERPIVLALARPGTLAPGVHPDTARVGLMLAYTPLHDLLLADVGVPLVVTSGNRSDEPIAIDDADAVTRLGGIADVIVGHDRPIHTRADDSVLAVSAGRGRVWRRSRGFVPTPILISQTFAEPVLAVGGHLKNTFAIGVEDEVYLGPHVGELDTPLALGALEDGVAWLERMLGVHPDIVAHDLHPDYASTQLARARPARVHVAVQHHHAHVVSLMAEAGLLDAEVLGLALDGTGDGGDGTAWGGELLKVTAGAAQRLATLRPIGLAGGERAIRQVWRLAQAILRDALGAEAPLERLLPEVTPLRGRQLDQLLAAGTVAAHGLGRWFDAVGALVLGQLEAAYEGQVAMALEQLAASYRGEARPYPWSLDGAASLHESGPDIGGMNPPAGAIASLHALPTIDLRPMVRALVRDLVDRVPGPEIAARFHATIADALVGAVEGLGPPSWPVLGSGGCFQNVLLAEALQARLGERLVLHERIPTGDGGLALGQALVARALTCNVKGEGPPAVGPSGGSSDVPQRAR
jgi:hydrogenase maturation protein HypF